MKSENFDIIVIGGGIAGLSATAAFLKLGLKTICLEYGLSPNSENHSHADIRSTAYLLNSIKLLKEIGVWESLEKNAQPLQTMSIINTEGHGSSSLNESRFDAKEINENEFGFNVPNRLTKLQLIKVIETYGSSPLVFSTRIKKIFYRNKEVIVLLEGNKTLKAKLIVGADGRHSHTRDSVGIKLQKWNTSQRALAFVVTHEKSHQNISTEIHQSGGPCTLVPLPLKEDGSHQSAVVWMEDKDIADDLLKLNTEAFNEKLTLRTQNIYGKCSLDSKSESYPIVNQIASTFYANRLALIAEAAHVMPPIGAQGLNTSFEDISVLKDLISKNKANGLDIGLLQLLQDYDRLRRTRVKARMVAVAVLNQASKSNKQIIKSLRTSALNLVNDSPKIKNILMNFGLGNYRPKN